MKRIYSVWVENRSGVLSKVSGLFARRSYNIDSLTVGETQDKTKSCMTISSSGTPQTLEQIEKQLNKKLDVIKVRTFDEDKAILREVILIKIKYNSSQRKELMEITDQHIRMVALDGHRIAMRREELREMYEDRKVIIPGKTLLEISRILSGDTEKNVDIFFTDKHVMFTFEDTIVVSRLIEGEYYKIDKMLSSSYRTRSTRSMLKRLPRSLESVRKKSRRFSSLPRASKIHVNRQRCSFPCRWCLPSAFCRP